MTRFKTEIKEKPKLTYQEEIQKMFDKRMQDIIKILQHHENGLKVNEIYSKVRLGESYIQKVIDDGFEKTKIKLIKEYRLNGVEIMTERDEHGRFVKKPKQDEPKVEDTVKIEQKEIKTELKAAEPITSEKKTITDHIREIAKEIGPFKPADMVKAFEVRNLPYSGASIISYIMALNVDATAGAPKSIHKHAFLKKNADKKYTIV